MAEVEASLPKHCCDWVWNGGATLWAFFSQTKVAHSARLNITSAYLRTGVQANSQKSAIRVGDYGVTVQLLAFQPSTSRYSWHQLSSQLKSTYHVEISEISPRSPKALQYKVGCNEHFYSQFSVHWSHSPAKVIVMSQLQRFCSLYLILCQYIFLASAQTSYPGVQLPSLTTTFRRRALLVLLTNSLELLAPSMGISVSGR